MLTIHNLSYYIGARAIYEDVSLQIKPKDKIGLIGANGTGKSTLLKLINGDITPDEGTLSKSNDCTLGYLNQDLLSYQSEDSILAVAMEAFAEAKQVQKEMDVVLHKMETDYHEDLVYKLTALQERFESLDGYSIQSQTEKILEGLGFRTEDLNKPLKNFSGGWRMRVMLAKLLLQKPALLMLDEPTNHLDLPSIQWIEQYLTSYEGATIVVSHDREFLDHTCNMIVEVRNQDLEIYQGNYSYYLEEKELRSEILKNTYENQQAKIKQTEKFIERFRAKASKSRQVQSRVKSLERMDLIEEIPDEEAKVLFRFQLRTQPGRHIVQLDHISKSYGDLHIIKNGTARIERGDKIALIGANGKGKSTLLRIISGEETFEGERVLGHQVESYSYAQHQLESLTVENSVIDELKTMGSTKSETELRSILGCFLFSSDDVFKKIKVLSGGERARVALAKTLVSQSNFLLLDEPTNHLDMTSVNRLIQAIAQYEGTVVLISHDRHFVRETANKIWFIEDYEIKEYPGTYDEYVKWNATRDLNLKNNPPVAKVSKTSAPAKPVNKPIDDKNSKKLKKEIEVLEKEIESLEKDIQEVELLLASEEVYSNEKELQKNTQKHTELLKNLILKQDTWETKMMELENL
jgi:ATP-binding cassette, subfamily F, member 3